MTIYEDEKETGPSDEALRRLPATILLAKEVAKGLGPGAVLF